MLSSAKRYKSSVKGNFMQAGWISNRKTWIAGSLCSSSSMFQKPKFYSSLFWPEERPFKPRKKGEKMGEPLSENALRRGRTRTEEHPTSLFKGALSPTHPSFSRLVSDMKLNNDFKCFPCQEKAFGFFKTFNPKVCWFPHQIWLAIFILGRKRGVRREGTRIMRLSSTTTATASSSSLFSYIIRLGGKAQQHHHNRDPSFCGGRGQEREERRRTRGLDVVRRPNKKDWMWGNFCIF